MRGAFRSQHRFQALYAFWIRVVEHNSTSFENAARLGYHGVLVFVDAVVGCFQKDAI